MVIGGVSNVYGKMEGHDFWILVARDVPASRLQYVQEFGKWDIVAYADKPPFGGQTWGQMHMENK